MIMHSQHKTKVRNMTGPSGATVPNQFIITGSHCGLLGEFYQSYKTVIAFKPSCGASITLDKDYWLQGSSRTTARYRNKFLNMNSNFISVCVANGSIILADLN